MKVQKYKWILYAIILVISFTIGIQIYWNYKNYINNKQRLINDVQLSLDKAVDDYYADLVTKTTLGLSLTGENQKSFLDDGGLLDRIAKNIDKTQNTYIQIDSLEVNSIEGVQVFRGLSADSLLRATSPSEKNISSDSVKWILQSKSKENSKLKDKKFEFLTSKVVISISNDTLNLKVLDSLFFEELNRKAIDINYDLKFYSKKDRLAYLKEHKQWPEKDLINTAKNELTTHSKSTFLPDQSVLFAHYSNTTKTLLKRSLSGILISFVLIIAVISTLFYLLKIIQNQKQLAEIKNDLISNITHEFKTPIATIGVALESIQGFNTIEDKEKTKSYLQMSSQQLDKLNLMVEKLLETASLDNTEIELDREPTDVVALLQSIVSRFQSQTPAKSFSFISKIPSFAKLIDEFHFENAINNIIDNAVKYGGNNISVSLKALGNQIEVSITDNGPGIPKPHQKMIFDKFYRVPKGNTHDVKGFGIGLFYTKTMIERHGGTITLVSDPGETTFNIILSHD